MDVDDRLRVARDESLAQHLHVTREHDHLDPRAFQQLQHLRLRIGLRLRGYRQAMERDAEALCHAAMVLVVADDERYSGAELLHAPAGKDIVEAVRQPGDEDGDAPLVVGEAQAPAHLEALRQRLEGVRNFAAGHAKAVQLPFDALDEDTFLLVGVLVGVNDVAVVAVEEIRDRGDKPLLVAAGEQQGGGDGVLAHGMRIIAAEARPGGVIIAGDGRLHYSEPAPLGRTRHPSPALRLLRPGGLSSGADESASRRTGGARRRPRPKASAPAVPLRARYDVLGARGGDHNRGRLLTGRHKRRA